MSFAFALNIGFLVLALFGLLDSDLFFFIELEAVVVLTVERPLTFGLKGSSGLTDTAFDTYGWLEADKSVEL
jgi:hypothetical protein